MAFPTNTFTATDLAVFIPEKWSDTINDFFKAKLVAADHFLNMTPDLAGGGDIIHIPNLTEMAASTKSNATAVTLVSPTETSVDLTVTTWKECSFAIEDSEADQIMRSYTLQQRYIQNAGYSIAKALDTAILGLYSGLSQSVNDSASAVADADILAAIQKLDEADVPAEDRAFFFYPSITWGDLMAIDKYTLLEQAGVAAVQKGMIAKLYGIPVISTTQVPITATDFVHNILAHKEAFAFATRPLPGAKENGVRLQSNYMADYLSTISTADIIYGVVENRDAAAVEIQSIK
ncbi:MAG: hypothetical protein AB1414_01115 [bacterium]